MKSLSSGKILITLVAIWTTCGAYFFDWNHTHIFNPRWTPHAKFHNAQTMLLGTCIGLITLWVLWVQKIDKKESLRLSIILGSIYWLTQIGSLFFPGTALVDPEFFHTGDLPKQLINDVVMLVMLGIAYPLELKRLKQ